jgi:putative DNA primase/helicase
MTAPGALEAALAYSRRGWPIFPCRERQPGRKRPYTLHGFHDASRDPDTVTKWWGDCWPEALIGLPTGQVSGVVVLDVDTKNDAANGFDTLEDLGRSTLPETPMAHTPSGGEHVYYEAGDRELKNSAGLIGPGLDVRATGGYVIIPSPGSGYMWDPQWNFDTVLPVSAPAWLWPPKVSRPAPGRPMAPVAGIGPYGEACINSACDAIWRAPPGQQERTLNAECFSIGTLAGAGVVPEAIALRALLRAATAMRDYDPAFPWRPEEIDYKIKRAFGAGMRRPREARRGK